MSFNPGGGTISGASDVAISSPVNDQALTYESSTSKWKNKTPSGGGGGSRPLSILVASAQAPANVKAGADYLCTGTNDEAKINAAISDAALQPSNPASYTSIGGYGKVVLSAGAFDINSPILMKTGVHLTGSGMLTELRARAIIGGAQAVVALNDPGVHLTRLNNLWINGNGTTGSAHGIHYINNVSAITGSPDNNSDGAHWIENIFISNTDVSSGQRHGIWTEGTGGGGRCSKLVDIQIAQIGGNGVYLQGSESTHLTSVDVTDVTNGGCGFVITSPNVVMTGCRIETCELDGFQLSGPYSTLVSCVSRGGGRWGFNVTGQNTSIAGCVADSNQAIDNTGGGLNVAANNVSIYGMNIMDNAVTAQQQTRGIQFTGTPVGSKVVATVSIPSGTNYVVGTINGTGNMVNVVRSGTTTITQGY